MDPDNHIYYSNRAAAYMTADSISKALRDAEKCVALAPTWAKGYSRLGAAQHGLKRLDAAINSFKKGKLYKVSYSQSVSHLVSQSVSQSLSYEYVSQSIYFLSILYTFIFVNIVLSQLDNSVLPFSRLHFSN